MRQVGQLGLAQETIARERYRRHGECHQNQQLGASSGATYVIRQRRNDCDGEQGNCDP